MGDVWRRSTCGGRALFNTGYMASMGVITALCGRGDVIFSDELNHASIIDGCRQSRAEIVVYRHNDAADRRPRPAVMRAAGA
ncbi:MAG: aminotransferase class I/II-fold pyridoxal phosphate-dependent enzyme [Desulfovibrio fairfieldensis]